MSPREEFDALVLSSEFVPAAVLAALRDCRDVMPDDVCEWASMPPGSTYADAAATMVSREDAFARIASEMAKHGVVPIKNNDGGFDVPQGIEPHLVPFVNAVQWRMEEELPSLAEHSFPYAEVDGRRIYLTNLVVALRQAFAWGRPTAGGRA